MDSAIGRRSVLIGGSVATASLTGFPALAGPVRATAGRAVRVRTTAGVVEGERVGRTAVFRGVPYAAPPVGELRFRSPRPPTPWRGVRPALRFGPVCYQPTGTDGSEDCLYANVWTPNTCGSRPVIVYIHGGGWQVGAGSLPNYDGGRLAARGDVVVVTFNYRLAGFGWGLHPALNDAETDSSGNWGLQDQVAALCWAKENAAAFGGDPDNITLCGTSAGGASTYQLARHPKTSTLIRRAVPISACHVWAPAISLTPADATTAYEKVAHKLHTTVSGLRAVPGLSLRDAWQEVFAGEPADRALCSGREYRGPVLDGRWLRGFDYEESPPGVPLMPIYTRTEASFFTGPGSPQPSPTPTNDAELRDAVRDVLLKGAAHVADDEVDTCIAAYREAAQADGRPVDPLSVWTEIWGDGLFRYQILRLAERQAVRGPSPQYLMEFTQPVNPPWFGTPHESTSKFLFGTYALPQNEAEFGDGPLQKTISDAFIDLVTSFARDGVPSARQVPDWPCFSADEPSTLVLGGERVARVQRPSKLRQLAYWDDAGWVPRPG